MSDAASLKAGTSRGGRGNEPFVVAHNDFTVRADIHKEGYFRISVHL